MFRPIQSDGAAYKARVDSRDKSIVYIQLEKYGKTYTITVRFDEPMDQKKIKEYLNLLSTKQKINTMTAKHKILSDTYSDKKDVKVKLTKSAEGEKAEVTFTKKLPDSPDLEKTKTKTFVMSKEDLDAKLNHLKEKKEKLVANLRASRENLGDDAASVQHLEAQEAKIAKLQLLIDQIGDLSPFISTKKLSAQRTRTPAPASAPTQTRARAPARAPEKELELEMETEEEEKEIEKEKEKESESEKPLHTSKKETEKEEAPQTVKSPWLKVEQPKPEEDNTNENIAMEDETKGEGG